MFHKLGPTSLFMIGFAPAYAVGMSVALTPSVPGTVPLGTPVTWSASVSDSSDGELWYRFRVRRLGSDFHLIRDYGPSPDLDWAASHREGAYEMEVAVLNHGTGDVAAASVSFQVSPQATDQPAVNPTTNPLVFLYSAPSCQDGSRIRVQFQATGGAIQSTPFKPCDPPWTMNFYIAGLKTNQTYTAWHITDDGSQFLQGPPVSFATGDSGAPPALFSQTTLRQPEGGAGSGILLASSFIAPAATDLNGNLIWYASNNISFITCVDPGGYFWGILEDSKQDQTQQQIRKFDLTGRTLLETNAARVNDQLAATGRRTISAFHHDVRTLPDGRIAALATVEQVLSGVQGSEGPVDILGDMIIVFDENLNVVWTWDTFDHLDVNRKAVLGEICTNAAGGCPPYYMAEVANDWTHGNSIQQTPDGNLLYSARHQDWVIKIAYNNGQGDGHVIWRLGKDGDFRFDSNDPYPWPSHQHDAGFLSSDPSTMLVFDNGNTRIKANGGHSRGQAIKIDEQNRVASLTLNADLGVFSLALGSAQKLPSGNYSFDAGYVVDPDALAGSSAHSIEVDSSGKIVYEAKADAIIYRWFRLTDIYSPN